MSEFDAAEAAVQAALDAGAVYADARVMHRRYESMTARNGDVEDLGQDETSGIGVRALVGSGWGFYAVPDLVDAAARAAGAQATAIATSSARVAREAIGPRARRGRPAGRGPASARSTRSACLARRQGRPARAGVGDDGRARRRHRRGDVPDLGHRQVVRVQRGPPHRPAHPRVRRRDHGHVDRRRRDAAPLVPGRARPVRHARAGRWSTEIDIEAHAARVADESRALLSAPPCPSRRDDADPRRRADGAADPRVGRPRHRARPHPRLGGRLRRHVVARPGPARRPAATARS